MVDHLATFFYVRQLSATEDDRHDDLVFVQQKAASLRDLEGDIVLARFGTNANFLGLGVMNVTLGEFLFLLVFELAKVHDATDRGSLVGCDFDQIQVGIASFCQCLVGADDSEQSTVGADNPNGRNSNLLVDPLRAFDKPRSFRFWTVK